MRTTLDIDDDVLAAAKELSRLQGRSAGAVVSSLLRQALTGSTARPGAPDEEPAVTSATAITGFRPFASAGRLVTNEQINTLRDAEGV
jgi:hypothetical protein